MQLYITRPICIWFRLRFYINISLAFECSPILNMRRFSLFCRSGRFPFTIPLLLSKPSEQTDILITLIRLWLVLLLWLVVSRKCSGKWTREINVRINERARHSSALSLSLWCIEAHYICIAFQVDSAIKSRPLLSTNFRIIYNLTGLLSSMRNTVLRKIIIIIISRPELGCNYFTCIKNKWVPLWPCGDLL